MEPSEPWVGPVPMAKERVSPSASVPARVMVLATSSVAETDWAWATGAWFTSDTVMVTVATFEATWPSEAW